MDSGGRRARKAWRGMLPLLAVHVVNEYFRLERKLLVTAGLLAANTLLLTIDEVWFNPHLILKGKLQAGEITVRLLAANTLLPTIDEVWFNPQLIDH